MAGVRCAWDLQKDILTARCLLRKSCFSDFFVGVYPCSASRLRIVLREIFPCKWRGSCRATSRDVTDEPSGNRAFWKHAFIAVSSAAVVFREPFLRPRILRSRRHPSTHFLTEHGFGCVFPSSFQTNRAIVAHLKGALLLPGGGLR